MHESLFHSRSFYISTFHFLLFFFLFDVCGELAYTYTNMRVRSTNRPSIAVKHGTFLRSLEMHTHIHIYGIRRMVKESIRVIVIVLRKRRKSIRIVKDKYRKKSYLRNCVKVLLNGTSLSSSERNEMRECVCPRLLYIIHPNSITVILCINV
jgi:hypothetical protein